MITNLGPNATRTTGDLTTFVGELSKRADANRDGSLTSAEFAQYLTQLLDRPEPTAAKLDVADQAAEILAAIRDRAPKTPVVTAPPAGAPRADVSTNGRVTNG